MMSSAAPVRFGPAKRAWVTGFSMMEVLVACSLLAVVGALLLSSSLKGAALALSPHHKARSLSAAEHQAQGQAWRALRAQVRREMGLPSGAEA